MTRIKKLRNILTEIDKAPITVGRKEFAEIMQKAGVPMPVAGMDSIKDKCVKSLHTTVQTEMMIEACVSAKRSCWLAAIAATASVASAIVSLVTIVAN